MPLPFAAPTVPGYDEKGLGRVQWLSYVYEKRNNGGRKAEAGAGGGGRVLKMER